MSFAAGETTPFKLTLASTYQSISVYASYDGTDTNNSAIMEYRKVGDTNWIRGIDMSAVRSTTNTSEKGNYAELDVDANYNPAGTIKPQFRSSVLMVQPDTEYEVKVTFSDPEGVLGTNPLTGIIRTRNENPPSTGKTVNVSTQTQLTAAVGAAVAGDNIVIAPGNYSGFTISKSGTSNNWITIKAADLNNKPKFAPTVGISGSYIRLTGFEVTGGVPSGIAVSPPGHDIIIEKMYVHHLNTPTGDNGGDLISVAFGYSNQENVSNVTIQDNDLHESGPNENQNGSIVVRAAKGGHIIRRNRIIYDIASTGVHGTDCISSLPNFAPWGGMFKDTDVYDNLCQGSTDDSFEFDGSNANVRVWNNTIIGGMKAFSTAPNFYGPLYIFRNTALAFNHHWTNNCSFFKDGNGGKGHVYFYHNTIYGADPTYCKTSGWEYQALMGFVKGDGADSQNNFTIKNNILQTYSRVYEGGPKTTNYNLIYEDPASGDKFAEWNGTNHWGFEAFVSSTGQDKNSINGKATFVAPPIIQRNGQVITSFQANMNLAAGSLGIDKGEVIQGINSKDSPWPYQGNGPDIGAFESNFNVGPTSTPTPVIGDCTVNAADLPPDAEEQKLLDKINTVYRSPENKYTWSNTLSQAAVWKAQDMANNNYLGLVDSLGRDVRTRLTDCGYNPTFPVGENVAGGLTFFYADNVLSNWVFDLAQWDLVVSPNYTIAGIAHAYGPFSTLKNYWVLVVGTTTPSTLPTITSTPTRTPTPTVPGGGGGTPTFAPTATFTPTRTPTPLPTATFTPTRTPTPLPTNTNTPTPTRTPTPTISFTPTLSPTRTPTVTPTPIPPTPCSLISGVWNVSPATVVQGTVVSLKVFSSGSCDGNLISFKVFNNNGLLPATQSLINPPTTTFNGNVATTTWVAEYVSDGLLGLGGNPEYYFEATHTQSSNKVISDLPDLTVTQLGGGVPTPTLTPTKTPTKTPTPTLAPTITTGPGTPTPIQSGPTLTPVPYSESSYGGGYSEGSYSSGGYSQGSYTSGSSNQPDINSSGKVDIFDLSILLRNWNKSGQGDLNSDSKIDIFDLSILLRSWTK